MSYHAVGRYPSNEMKSLLTHGTPILVVSCSGFYLLNQTYKMIHPPFGIEEYDSLAIPGSSAGVINYHDWHTSFFQQLKLLESIHHSILIYIIDHQDCGVYKSLYGSDEGTESFVHHAENMIGLKREILSLYPHIDVKTLLASTDGMLYQLQ